MDYAKIFSEYCDSRIRQYTVTISNTNLPHAVRQQQVRNSYASHKTILEKLFSEEIENINSHAQVDTKQLRNITIDKLREFKYKTQDDFDGIQL